MPEPLLDTEAPTDPSPPAERDAEAGDRKPEILRPAQIFDPVARALDVIGDRWTLVLVRQLLAGPKGFQELRVRTGIAPRVLSSRLRQLRTDGFVETEAQGSRSLYRATEKGRTLSPIISSIARWWVHEGISVRDVDPTRFTETSALSVLEALPNLLREDTARCASGLRDPPERRGRGRLDGRDRRGPMPGPGWLRRRRGRPLHGLDPRLVRGGARPPRRQGSRSQGAPPQGRRPPGYGSILLPDCRDRTLAFRRRMNRCRKAGRERLLGGHAFQSNPDQGDSP